MRLLLVLLLLLNGAAAATHCYSQPDCTGSTNGRLCFNATRGYCSAQESIPCDPHTLCPEFGQCIGVCSNNPSIFCELGVASCGGIGN